LISLPESSPSLPLITTTPTEKVSCDCPVMKDACVVTFL
jgi:hypothetical protein